MFGIPTPTKLPFSLCAPNLGGEECLTADAAEFGLPRDCGYYQTPPLVSTDIKYIKKEWTWWGGTNVKFSLSFWVGVETDLSGIWIGEPHSETCIWIPASPLSPTVVSIPEIIEELEYLKPEIEDALESVGHTDPSDVVKAIILVAIAILFFIASGGSVGS